jgi:hypothetical protein
MRIASSEQRRHADLLRSRGRVLETDEAPPLAHRGIHADVAGIVHTIRFRIGERRRVQWRELGPVRDAAMHRERHDHRVLVRIHDRVMKPPFHIARLPPHEAGEAFNRQIDPFPLAAFGHVRGG